MKKSQSMFSCGGGGGESLYGIREAKGVKREGFNKENNSARSAHKGRLTLHTSPLTLIAFTMAEILLSLTIIGVVAAITLPSLTGNINERTWNTQRKALYARFSQAIALMPALNGYGAVSDDTTLINNSAEVFITNGLSKVLKINNICGSSNVADCGISEKLADVAGATVTMPTKISELNEGLPSLETGKIIKDTKAAALETANGESVLVFYNPYCTAKNVLSGGIDAFGNTGFYIKQHVCANFVYDLNGKKGPNTFGKDIGIMSAIYSSDTNVVMPMAPKKLSGSKTYIEATEACSSFDDGAYRLPNLEEVLSIYWNKFATGEWTGNEVWSSSAVDSEKVWTMGGSGGIKYGKVKTGSHGTICVKR